ncbi:MAG TPA: hypothetical protein VLA12_02935 [Planctomycetaceae bacterium]|nr:hypothetical protein [Planctomycetaceae bacterium]
MRCGAELSVLLNVLLLGVVLPAAGQPPRGPRIEAVDVLSTKSDVEGRRSIIDRITGKPDEQIFVRPYAAAWIGNSLFVTDPGTSSILQLVEGKIVRRFTPERMETPVGIAECNDAIFVTDSSRGRIGSYDKSMSRWEWLDIELVRPTGVACMEEHLFVVETGLHRVVELRNGAIVRKFGERGSGDGQFNFPTLIVISNAGEIFVGDSMNFRIQRFNLNGGFMGAFGSLGDSPGSMPRIKGVAIDDAGNLWVSDAHLDRVAVYDRDGRFLLDVGRGGQEPGAFSFPAGIAIRGDRVAIVDSLNRRVQILGVETATEASP